MGTPIAGAQIVPGSGTNVNLGGTNMINTLLNVAKLQEAKRQFDIGTAKESYVKFIEIAGQYVQGGPMAVMESTQDMLSSLMSRMPGMNEKDVKANLKIFFEDANLNWQQKIDAMFEGMLGFNKKTYEEEKIRQQMATPPVHLGDFGIQGGGQVQAAPTASIGPPKPPQTQLGLRHEAPTTGTAEFESKYKELRNDPEMVQWAYQRAESYPPSSMEESLKLEVGSALGLAKLHDDGSYEISDQTERGRRYLAWLAPGKFEAPPEPATMPKTHLEKTQILGTAVEFSSVLDAGETPGLPAEQERHNQKVEERIEQIEVTDIDPDRAHQMKVNILTQLKQPKGWAAKYNYWTQAGNDPARARQVFAVLGGAVPGEPVTDEKVRAGLQRYADVVLTSPAVVARINATVKAELLEMQMDNMQTQIDNMLPMMNFMLQKDIHEFNKEKTSWQQGFDQFKLKMTTDIELAKFNAQQGSKLDKEIVTATEKLGDALSGGGYPSGFQNENQMRKGLLKPEIKAAWVNLAKLLATKNGVSLQTINLTWKDANLWQQIFGGGKERGITAPTAPGMEEFMPPSVGPSGPTQEEQSEAANEAEEFRKRHQ